MHKIKIVNETRAVWLNPNKDFSFGSQNSSPKADFTLRTGEEFEVDLTATGIFFEPSFVDLECTVSGSFVNFYNKSQPSPTLCVTSIAF